MRSTDLKDWIVAPATPPGHGAVAVVRLDGPGCWNAAARVWRPLHAPLSDAPPTPRRLTLGEVFRLEADGGAAPIDQALAAFFPGPNSYTGNDLVEFQCHGAPAVVEAVVAALTAAGARLARPGEFTERAFLNGRLDLARAEAVADLVSARTEAASRAALAQLNGGLSERVAAARGAALEIAAEIEAGLDFPEEETGAAERERLRGLFAEALGETRRLAESYRRGRLLREGARVALAGRPNAGKSSLFNKLVGMERAIVTPHPGTTRDTIEATLDLDGAPVTLVDTAGIRETGEASAVERLGIDRTKREVERADLVLFLLDGGGTPDAGDFDIYNFIKNQPRLVVVNKADLAADRAAPLWNAREKPIWVSAHTGEGLAELERRIARALQADKDEAPGAETAAPPDGGGTGAAVRREAALVTNLRHAELLTSAARALERAAAAFEAGLYSELVMVDVSEALESLGGILGLAVDDAVLDRIFARFCIGK